MEMGFTRTKFMFLLFGVFLFLISFGFSITGNVIGNIISPSVLSFVGLIIIIATLVLMVKGDSLEAIIVPTGPSPMESQRAIRGANRFHKNEDRYVIISGEYNNGKYVGSQPEKLHDILRGEGVPENKIIFEHKSKDTMGNVLYICDILKKKGIKKIIVATDKQHAKRWKMLFDRAKEIGYIPKDLRVRTDTKNIDNAYSSFKAKAMYLKDKIRSLKK